MFMLVMRVPTPACSSSRTWNVHRVPSGPGGCAETGFGEKERATCERCTVISTRTLMNCGPAAPEVMVTVLGYAPVPVRYFGSMVICRVNGLSADTWPDSVETWIQGASARALKAIGFT